MAAITLRIGPAPSDMAATWVASCKEIIAAIRAQQANLPIWVHDDTLFACDVLLDLWATHAARNEVFDWSYSADEDIVVQIARQWLELGSLTDEQLATVGASWAPRWTRPFSDAVVVGVGAALEQCGPAGAALLARLRPAG